ncbi:hypothetical protein [Asticcacaulis solisilvae]|uniref:hypothetical protein n=1 Tax=Asticcacaulis solisilvae TaxID=1217274 RepID=UPI003FD741B9
MPEGYDLARAMGPRLRIFFSIDLCGSTKLKQGVGEAQWKISGELVQDAWQTVILDFYKEFNTYLSEACETARSKKQSYQSYVPRNFEFWKSVGDELLYTAEIEVPDQAMIFTTIWLDALQRYGQKIRQIHGLDVKSTAWLAGFPIRNCEVIFEVGEPRKLDLEDASLGQARQYVLLKEWYSGVEHRNGLMIDFIGPSIDTGFRVSQHSVPSRMCLSVDLTWMLAQKNSNTDLGELSFHYIGRRQLKGVAGGRDYPIFAVDVPCEDKFLEAEIRMLKVQELDNTHIAKTCEAYISNKAHMVGIPFVPNSKETVFDKHPEDYYEKLRNRQAFLENEVAKAQDLKNSMHDGEVSGTDINIDQKMSILKTIQPDASPSDGEQARPA